VAGDDRPHPLSAVELVASRPEWADEFTAVAGERRGLLGRRALLVQHIGSTSVPGLAAKDVVDVQVVVAELESLVLEGFERPLGEGVLHDHVPAGWAGEEREWEKLLFVRQRPRPVHVHVRREGAANTRYALLFRDYLRADVGARGRWETVKRQVAASSVDRRAYAVAKDPLTDRLMVAAERWAVLSGWTPPRVSD
jgi:GrpB-like predicted nucleotidyltransferase (UPF0157 family)